MLNGLDLFTGIGGITLALQQYVKPLAYCEIDLYCQSVLISRMEDRLLPAAPIWDDVSTLPTQQFSGKVDIVYGGFPCQGFSMAGFKKGLADERSDLFFELLRVVKELQPKFIFLENVPNLCNTGGRRVVNEIAFLGYDCRWCVVPAALYGALHERKRWFLLAYSKSERLEPERFPVREEAKQPLSSSNDQYTHGDKGTQIEPPVCGVVDAIPYRMDRIKALGNAVVPIQVKRAFELLVGKNEN